MASLKKKLCEYVDSHKTEAIRLFQSLIRRNSVNYGSVSDQGNEKDLVQIIKKWMKPQNLEIQVIEPYPKRSSIVGRKRGSRGKPILCFYAHLDTVPAGDVSKWKHPPFRGEIHDGRLYGRGAFDVKQGIASSLFAIKVLHEMNVELKGDLLLAYSAGEETGGLYGLPHMIEMGMVKADYCVYPHNGIPDDSRLPFTIGLGHRGGVHIKIKTIGKAGHMARALMVEYSFRR